jgi:hypothetical protein
MFFKEAPERNPTTFSKSFLAASKRKNIFFEATLSRKKNPISEL